MKRSIFAAVAALACAAAFAQQIATRVDVTSQPEGASVIVDGQDRGVTPLALFDLAPGSHHLKYRLAGYVEHDRTFELVSGVPVQRNVVLELEKGILLVKSEPEGCSISIDGLNVGLTPRLITNLNTKDKYRVTLRKTGYRNSTFEVKFSGRTPVVRNETLILDTGVLDLMSDPEGAEVTVNGIVRGKTPVKVDNVPKGRSSVQFKLDGFKDEVREISMNAGDRQTVMVTMQGQPGTLYLSSVPDGARFYVNGAYRGKGLVVLPGLTPGEYSVKAELEGFGSETRTVNVGNGSAPREEFRLTNVRGRLEVCTSPVGATVVVDGKVMGVTRSADPSADRSDVFAVENLNEGDHVLVVRKDGYGEKTRHPKIASQKTTQANVKLERVFVPNIEIVTDTGTTRGVLVNNSPDYVTVEVSMGIQRSFPRVDIRKIVFLTDQLGERK